MVGFFNKMLKMSGKATCVHVCMYIHVKIQQWYKYMYTCCTCTCTKAVHVHVRTCISHNIE